MIQELTVWCAPLMPDSKERELIFRLVYEQAGCRKNETPRISSMEESAIIDGFENLKPGKRLWCLIYTSLHFCRQQADWLVGLNGTKLFTALYGGCIKGGQGEDAHLAMLVDRETKIMNFKKEVITWLIFWWMG